VRGAGYHRPMPEPDTQQLQIVQRRREAEEREQAEQATDEHEAITHQRRAERVSYLRDKLAERARSEDEAGTGRS
jgi:hypothetical protein